MKIFEAGYLSQKELNINGQCHSTRKTIKKIIAILMIKLVISEMSKIQVHDKSSC